MSATKSKLNDRYAAVRELYQAGTTSAKDISELLKLPKSTCYQYVQRLQKQGSLTPAHRSGRPPKLTPRKVRQADKMLKKNPFATAKEIKHQLQKRFDFTLSERTVRWVLANKLNYKTGKPKAVPMMTAKHVEKRLEFCKKYLNVDWEHTVFSDETSIQMHQNNILVRWKEGMPRPRAAKPKHPYKCHFWGAISANGTIGCYLWDDQTLDGNLYRWILRTKLFRQAKAKVGKRWGFQQDNDPKHTAKATKELLAKNVPLGVVDWPANSPDLNPIENLWAWMKRRIEQWEKQSILRGKNVTTVMFRRLVMRAWNDVKSGMCRDLIYSMKGRIKKCQELNGQTIDM